VPQLALHAQANGLIVDAKIWHSAPRRAEMFKRGMDVQHAIPVTMIIDTGADSTMISDQIARSLRLQVTDQTRMYTANSKGVDETCDICDVELEILNPVQRSWRIPALPVVVRPLLNISMDGMIGRDLLALGVLHYDGPRARFTLDYL